MREAACDPLSPSRPRATACLEGLQGLLHDDEHGGWFAAIDPTTGTPTADGAKACYDHAFVLLAASSAWGHAFPDHSERRVGHTVDASPPAVRIWFDGAIEPVFSTVRVEDADERRVDNNDARVAPGD